MAYPPSFDEAAVITMIRTLFLLSHPTLYKWLFEPEGQAKGAIERILLYRAHDQDLTTEQALSVVRELHRVLTHPALCRCPTHQRILAGTTLSTLLGRPQFGDANGLSKLCQLGANPATAVSRLKTRLANVYAESEVLVRIRFSERGRGMWPYSPEFDFADPTGAFPLRPSKRPDTIIRRVFGQAACAVHLAKLLRCASSSVVIYGHTCRRLLDQRSLEDAACDPTRGGKLAVALLDPSDAGKERRAAEQSAQRLRQWKALAGRAELEIIHHHETHCRTTIIAISGGDLLVRAGRSGEYLEVRVGDPYHAYFESQIPNLPRVARDFAGT